MNAGCAGDLRERYKEAKTLGNADQPRMDRGHGWCAGQRCRGRGDDCFGWLLSGEPQDMLMYIRSRLPDDWAGIGHLFGFHNRECARLERAGIENGSETCGSARSLFRSRLCGCSQIQLGHRWVGVCSHQSKSAKGSRLPERILLNPVRKTAGKEGLVRLTEGPERQAPLGKGRAGPLHEIGQSVGAVVLENVCFLFANSRSDPYAETMSPIGRFRLGAAEGEEDPCCDSSNGYEQSDFLPMSPHGGVWHEPGGSGSQECTLGAADGQLGLELVPSRESVEMLVVEKEK
jgi:hypothetical protein